MPALTCRDGVYESRGFIDLQVNGFAGVDFNSPDAPAEEIAKAIRALFATGVTRFFPTVITGAPDDMTGALRNLSNAKESLAKGEGRAIEAFHVEGPAISSQDGPRGAHPRHWVRHPDLDEFHRMQEASRGLVRLLTLAPEWPGAPQFIEALVSEGIVVSIGHTRASTAQIRDAVAAGATMSTHLGNGTDPMLAKHNNYIWDQLADDRLTASFIVDGHHLPESYLRVAFRAKGPDRSVLVTDAAMPAMCEPGHYMLGGVEVTKLDDERVVLRDGARLAGSSLSMDRAIGNAVRYGGVTLEQAATMATENPARAARIPDSGTVKFRFEGGVVKVIETNA